MNKEEKTEKNKGSSHMFWCAIGLAASCAAYVLSGKVWFLILGISATTFAMVFED
jgi:hypothetical protein